MAAQRKNLLEAFKNAGDLPEPKPRPPAKASPKPSKPSLFETLREKRAASRSPRATREPSDTPDSTSRSSRLKMPSLSLLPGELPPGLLMAAGAGVLLAVGVAIGRASRPEVEAADGSSQAGSISELMGADTDSGGIVPGRERGAAGQLGGGSLSSNSRGPRNMGVRGTRDTLDAERRTKIEDSPLFDAGNRYTIVVQTYTLANTDHAWATYEHLRSEGLRVFPPVVKDEYLLILVGAAPSSKDLALVQERIRKLQRDGEFAYHDAYRAPIDNYIER